MAGENGEDGTDTTSIRPVSSLRSRFENLQTDPTKTPSSQGRPTSRLSQYLPDLPPVERSSLDVPRPSIAQSLQPPVGKQELGTGLLRQSTGRQLGAQNGARPPRPVSMGPASPPKTPALLVQSPQSPPRPVFNAGAGLSGAASPPRPKSVGAMTIPLVPAPITPVKTADVDAPVSPTSGKRLARPPPPVNRAAKPVLFSSSLPSSLAPQPLKMEDNSVSPFNTPPDSPRSSGSPRKGSPAKEASFPPPPLHFQVKSRRQPQQPPAIDTFSSNKDPYFDPSDEPGRRPSLPARSIQREPTKTPMTPQGPVPNRSRNSPMDPSNIYMPSPRRVSETAPPPLPEPRRTPSRTQAPPRPSEASKDVRRPSQTQTFLPPPKRITSTNGSHAAQAPLAPPTEISESAPRRSLSQRRDISPRQQIRRVDADDSELSDAFVPEKGISEYPDVTQANRRPPRSKYGLDKIYTHYDTRLLDICGRNMCTSGYITRAWDVATGKMSLDMSREEREVKVLSMVFKPGTSSESEGQVIWLGDNYGEIQEVSLEYKKVLNYRPGAHGRYDIIKMHRYQNTIWSMDSEGRLLVWLPNKDGVPDLDVSPNSHRVAKGHTYSMIARDKLWLATGRELRVYDPASGHERLFHVVQQPLCQPGTGEITSGAVLPTQLDRVYFGHSDGKVSIYSTDDYRCVSVVNVSSYKITTMAGVGPYIWAGFTTGYLYVYDMKQRPWKAKKEWKAHDNPVASIVVDQSSVWKLGHLQVASLGQDNTVKFWDGMLQDDWVEDEMQAHDVDFCQFRELKATVVTWNAGASTPMDIRHDEKDENFFREVIKPHDPPDILVFGFQELVDLEDKSLTAKNFFKGRHKSKNHDPDQMGHQYRAWRDFLVRNLIDNMPLEESYSLVQTGNLVGLFSCIFIKSSQRDRVRDIQMTEVKRGMGGLYGNKGAIIIRFIIDSTSLCFTNCHLAAGQKETLSRNNDATSILESGSLPQVRDAEERIDTYVNGGDGSMIMDHSICVLNGDLNYRIDTMGRDSVVKTIKAGNLDRLLERDQLLLSRRRNPGFRLRNFKEERITFAPTYKYDVRTDRYDSSEKNRSPAWCDRILYRGPGRIKMTEYRRHECWASDHRPVSGSFKMRIKTVLPDRRERTREDVQNRLVAMKMEIAETIRLDYLVNVLGVDPKEARRLAKGS